MSAVGVGVGIARALAIGRVGLKLGDLLGKSGETLMEVIKDKERVTPNEAEHWASQALRQEDFRVMVRGRDVMDAESQDHLIRGFARIIRNIFDAIKDEPRSA